MSQKKTIYSEEEKVFIRSLVIKNKDVVENKKSDVVTVVAKMKCWEKITEDFNCSGRFPQRSVSQISKLWENVKGRRMAQLSVEKRSRLKTGGGPYTSDILPDPELDSLGVDIEMRDAIDSDTVAYALVEDELLALQDEPGSKIQKEEEALRVERNQLIYEHEQLLFNEKMREAKLRTSLMEQEILHNT